MAKPHGAQWPNNSWHVPRCPGLITPLCLRGLPPAWQRNTKRGSSCDHRYFARQAAALKRLAEAEEQETQAKRENRHFAYPWAPVEFVWEAYFYLRKREGPGTPLPSKREVRVQAALIWAFYDAGIAAKLPAYLWENRGLTAREFRDIEARQKRRLRKAAGGTWALYFDAAGLNGLPQEQAGGVRKKQLRNPRQNPEK